MKFWIEDSKLEHSGTWPKDRLTALKEARKKWKVIAEYHTENPYDDDKIMTAASLHTCPLCVAFFDEERKKRECAKCPIAQHTGKGWCVGTPVGGGTKTRIC